MTRAFTQETTLCPSAQHYWGWARWKKCSREAIWYYMLACEKKKERERECRKCLVGSAGAEVVKKENHVRINISAGIKHLRSRTKKKFSFPKLDSRPFWIRKHRRNGFTDSSLRFAYMLLLFTDSPLVLRARYKTNFATILLRVYDALPLLLMRYVILPQLSSLQFFLRNIGAKLRIAAMFLSIYCRFETRPVPFAWILHEL